MPSVRTCSPFLLQIWVAFESKVDVGSWLLFQSVADVYLWVEKKEHKDTCICGQIIKLFLC